MTSSTPESGRSARKGAGGRRRTPVRRFRRAAALGCLAALLLLPAPLLARGKDVRKPVRIAYQGFNRQMMVDEHNKPTSGYAHDYIEAIGTYAGWDVRFVPCDSFADSVRMILAGEVDLIYEISYTEERAKLVLFPDEPMGHEYYYLYAAEDNASIVPDDYSTLAGRTVGVTSGTISLRVSKKESAKPGCGAFEFRCRDNGIGMSEEFARTIFEPFTREESSTVSRAQGTGLGMAITKSIVDRMGGAISVSSKKGEGTEFVVAVDFRLDA